MRIWKMSAKVHICSVVLSALCATLFLGTTIASQPAEARSVTYNLDIPAQNLNDALQAFALVSQHKLLYSSVLVDGKRSPALKGQYTTEQAVKALLSGTRLDYEVTSDGLVLIRAEDQSQRTGNAPAAGGDDPSGAASSAQEGKKNSSSGFRVAQVDQGTPGSSSLASDRSSEKKAREEGLTEIVVTAEKREERLQDVPVPVTAISAQTLVDNHELRIQDYYTRVPGLVVTSDDTDGGGPNLAIRGISTGAYTNPTVGITVDDVPFGSSTVLGGGAQAPDLDPSDLARVEVLRGPQGTLYGVSSIGGLVKFVTLDPSTDAVSGHLQGDLSSVYNSAETGYGLRAGVNLPLSDTLAIRASGFARRDPGYIDNVETGQRGINQTTAEGGRLSALWRPSDNAVLKISALLQDTKAHGSSVVTTGLSDLQQDTSRGAEGQERKLQAYSVSFKDKVGDVDVVSLTGFNVATLSGAVDITQQLGQFFTLPQFGVTGTAIEETGESKKFSQEIRLSGSFGQHFEWLVGGFYTRESSAYDGIILATNPVTGAKAGTWLSEDLFPTTYSEYAAFTDLTFLITDQFDIQVGGREGFNRQSYMETAYGVFDPIILGVPSPVLQPEVDTKASSFTYLVTPRFKLSPDMMVYARLASGYRAGGPNSTSTIFHLPPSFKPDTTQNYELGFKADFVDHKISIDSSLYYIDWKDIQLQINAACGCAIYFANGSRAKSEGVEVSLEARPLTGWTIAAWIALNNAVLTEGFPVTSSVYGASGDRLPYASRLSGNVSIDRDFDISSRLKGFVGAAESYVSDREGVFTSSAQRQQFGGYAKADLHAGAKLDSWTFTLFVNNAADKRGALSGGIGSYYPNGITYIQPRTAGLSVSRTF